MNKLLFIVFAAFSAACSDTTPLPADPQATPETQALYRNLFRIADEGVMFGHQDDALYGHDWKYEEGRSDVRECCGDYPAVFGGSSEDLKQGPTEASTTFLSPRSPVCCVPPTGAEP